MMKHLSNTSRAKDKQTLSNLDDLDLALKAEARFAKRERITQPSTPIRLTRFGLFIAGLWTGAANIAFVAFVTRVSGQLAGMAVLFGTILVLVVIGISMRGDK